jgi:hypothetical protein
VNGFILKGVGQYAALVGKVEEARALIAAGAAPNTSFSESVLPSISPMYPCCQFSQVGSSQPNLTSTKDIMEALVEIRAHIEAIISIANRSDIDVDTKTNIVEKQRDICEAVDNAIKAQQLIERAANLAKAQEEATRQLNRILAERQETERELEKTRAASAAAAAGATAASPASAAAAGATAAPPATGAASAAAAGATTAPPPTFSAAATGAASAAAAGATAAPPATFSAASAAAAGATTPLPPAFSAAATGTASAASAGATAAPPATGAASAAAAGATTAPPATGAAALAAKSSDGSNVKASPSQSKPARSIEKLHDMLGIFQLVMPEGRNHRKDASMRVRKFRDKLFVGDEDVTDAEFVCGEMGAISASADQLEGSFVDSVNIDEEGTVVVELEMVRGLVTGNEDGRITVLSAYGQFFTSADLVEVFVRDADRTYALAERPAMDIMFQCVWCVPSVVWIPEHQESYLEAKWPTIVPSEHAVTMRIGENRRVFAVVNVDGEEIRCDVSTPEVPMVREAVARGRSNALVHLIYSAKRDNKMVAKNVRFV